VAGFCEHGNEPSGSIKIGGHFLTGWVTISFCERGDEPSGSIKKGGHFWQAEWPSAFQIMSLHHGVSK
jgi:hypothetical protein